MKRAVPILLAMFALSAAVHAADDTEKLLDSTRVGNVLKLRLTKPNASNPSVVSYEIDAQRGGILHDGDTFAAEGAVDITYEKFNPLTMSYSSEQTAFDDSAQKAINQFLPGLIAMTKAVVPVPLEGTAGSDTAAAGFTDDCAAQALRVRDAVRANQIEAQSKLTEEQKRKVESPTAQADTAFRVALALCVRCDELAGRVGALRVIIRSKEATQFKETTLNQWIADATGLQGVIRTRIALQTEIKKWQKNRDEAAGAKEEAQKLLTELRAAAGTRRETERELVAALRGAAALRTHLAECEIFAAETVNEASDFAARAQAVVDRDNRLMEGLNTILAVLMGAEQQRWRNNDVDIVIDTAEPSPAQGKRVKVTLKAIQFSYNMANNTISRSTGIDATRTFDVRRQRRLVTEYGIAGVYNDLRYPKYSVKEEEGVRTVAREFETSNVNLAATLNFLCGTCIGSGVYPGFQFGISQAKDYPGLLAGGVLRFGGTTRISVASGVMVTWYNDLNQLTVGGPVESEDKLKNDLKLRRSPAAWYLAVQYTFK